MLDLTTEKGRFIAAALSLAGDKGWDQLTLAEIAERAGSNLVGLKQHFDSKSAILSAFIDLVDEEVLSQATVRSADQSARDALFEVIMCRFDVLEPWKAGVRAIAKSAVPDPTQLGQILSSQRWMLEAAGIGGGGLEGAVRVAGLASVYAGVFRVWLDDEDPGLARTMAALDRRLRRGERIMKRTDEAFSEAETRGQRGVRCRGCRALTHGCHPQAATGDTNPQLKPIASLPPLERDKVLVQPPTQTAAELNHSRHRTES
ncbi:MAG: TetR family transcriptional regulator [Hyphomicrobiaceae bacterium]